MEWRRFHYICRRSHNQLKPGEALKDCIERIETEAGNDYYGNSKQTNTLPYRLLQALKQAPDAQRAQQALRTYGDLDFSASLSEPLQFKRVMVYLGYVTFIFFVTSNLYQLKVAPALLETFEAMPISAPPTLLGYQGYWSLLSVLVFVLLLSILAIGYRLRLLFSYKTEAHQTLTFRYLTFPKIRRAYTQILEVAAFPVSNCSTYRPAESSGLTQHLQSIERSGMDTSREMQELVRQAGIQLTHSCERQMRMLSVIVSLIIIAAIFKFVANVYAPIFFLGETI